MLNRRDLQIGACLILADMALPALAQEATVEIEGELPPLPDDLVALEGLAPVTTYDETSVVGVQKPSEEEIAEASKILLGSPFKCEPIDVAQYFYQVASGIKYPREWAKFGREWPVRANPLIHHFFTATQTFPEGDTTAWCAAFVNWCIARSRADTSESIGKTPNYYIQKGKTFDNTVLSKTSKSASSGSFRCFPEKTDAAYGDIVVWRRPGTEGTTKYCYGQGHVAFFIARADEKIRVLGGNQRDGKSGGGVTIAKWPQDTKTHKLHGFRDWNRAT